jgi:glycosyltransferase involved in cell wall biosynthesis
VPGTCDPDLIIGTCCRIAPAKHIELLIDVMSLLTPRLPGVSLVVVGGVDPRHVPYWQTVVGKLQQSGLRNVFFVGGHADVRPFLRLFRVFVMISDNQGCPNASLEAMAMGLPVVANPSGGTAEQIEDGVNGYLISDQEPGEMAERVESLLRHPELREQLGVAGTRIAREKFSMRLMVDRYLQLFAEPDKEP